MIHNMKLAHKPFQMIASGQKTIELRLYDEKRQLISVGDELCFTDAENSKQIRARVAALHIFDSFDELYRSLSMIKCGYTPENVSKASPDDMLKYYPYEKQQLYKAVGIELTLISE